MSRPPVLSAASAALLEDTVAAAADAVDTAGLSPDRALAKAASDLGLHMRFVPLAVRGYNNGRAARQLASSDDPWERAAGYPQASIDGVMTHLAEGAKTAVEACGAGDYAMPPEKPLGPPPAVPSDAEAEEEDKLTKKAAELRSKVAAERAAEANAEVKRKGLADPNAVAFEARLLANKYAACVAALPADEAAGVRTLVGRRYPGIVPLLYGRTDKQAKPLFPVKPVAASTAIGWDHPALALAGELADVLARPTVPYPAKEGADAPRGVAVHPPGHLPEVKTADVFHSLGNVIGGVRGMAPPIGTLVAGAGRGSPDDKPKGALGAVLGPYDQLRARMRTATEAAAQARTDAMVERAQKSILPGPETKFDRQLETAGYHEALNRMLGDPRFHGADPQQVVRAYKDLHGLAPTVMQNPAVAGDFVHRVLQTGPLGYHDLAQLTAIEKNVTTAKRDRDHDDD